VVAKRMGGVAAGVIFDRPGDATSEVVEVLIGLVDSGVRVGDIFEDVDLREDHLLALAAQVLEDRNVGGGEGLVDEAGEAVTDLAEEREESDAGSQDACGHRQRLGDACIRFSRKMARHGVRALAHAPS
jgi:hypothetical protein